MVKRFLTVILLCIALIGCKEKVEIFGIKIGGSDSSEVVEPVNKEQAGADIDGTFLFSRADKIEVISYDVRNMWDTLNTEGVVKNKRLNIDTKRIEERVVLNNKLKIDLFNFLFKEDCGDGGSNANCFDPRHSIVL